MIKQIFILTLLIIVFISCRKDDNITNSETLNIDWEQTIDRDGSVDILEMINTLDKGFAIMLFDEKYSLLKFDSSGVLQWEHNLNFIPISVIQTADSGYIASSFNSSSIEEENFKLIKLNSYGDFIWEKGYKFGVIDNVNKLIRTIDGNIVLVGSTYNKIEDLNINPDVLIVKFKPNGDVNWFKIIKNSHYDYSRYIIEDHNGDYIIIGNSDTDTLSAVSIIKINLHGDLVWKTFHENELIDYPVKILCNNENNNYIMLGAKAKWTHEPYIQFDHWLVNINLKGDIKWEKTFGDESFNEDPTILTQITDGNYIFGGSYFTYDYEPYCFLYKMDNSGLILWEKELSNPFFTGGDCFGINSSNNSVIIAAPTRKNIREFSLWIVKLKDL